MRVERDVVESGADPVGMPGVEARARGGFLALAAGDALGWPQEVPRRVRAPRSLPEPQVEFTSWTRRGGTRFRPYDEEIGSGEYSDDTQLALAVARSRARHGEAWWEALTRTELPLWMLYERGGGGATRRAARAWAAGRPPWESGGAGEIARYFRAGGNGAAMRVLPHAVFRAEAAADRVARDAVHDGSATHGHPRALVGAAAYACAAWYLVRQRDTLRYGELLEALLDGVSSWARFPDPEAERASWTDAVLESVPDYEDSWGRVVVETRKLLEAARAGVRQGPLADDRTVMDTLGCFGPEKGSGTISAAAAVYLASRYAANPRGGILRAAFTRPADTDTLAAMAGGLLGCLAGLDRLPGPWRSVQDADYLCRLASRLALGAEREPAVPVAPALGADAVFRTLAENGGDELALGGTLRARATPWRGARPVSRSLRMESWRLVTSDGQTMYIHRLEKNERPSGSRRTETSTGDTPLRRSGAGRLPLAAADRAPRSDSSRRGERGALPEASAPFVAVRGFAARLAPELRERGAGLAANAGAIEDATDRLPANGDRLARLPTEERRTVVLYARHLLDTGRLPSLAIELVPVSVARDASRIVVKGDRLPSTSVGLLVERRRGGRRSFAVERDRTNSMARLDLELPASLEFETESDAVSWLTSLCSRMLG